MCKLLGKLVPPPALVKKAVPAVTRQAPSNALKAVPAPAVLKGPAANLADALPTKKLVSAKTAAVGLAVAGGATLLLGGKQLRGAIAEATGLDLGFLEAPGNLLSGVGDSLTEMISAAVGVGVTVLSAYVAWGALADAGMACRVGGTLVLTAAVGFAAAVTLDKPAPAAVVAV
ncbi:hypothetical protein T492DRAFT_843093 [Pavlovales sp. CCMP2436]|nr:hypothetical protein T492DRAFT_843093 [Pavlovales sp. CCMP2436]